MNNSWYNIKVREEVLADIEIFLKDNPNHSIIIEKISNLSVRDMMDVNYMTTIKEIADCYSFVDYVKERYYYYRNKKYGNSQFWEAASNERYIAYNGKWYEFISRMLRKYCLFGDNVLFVGTANGEEIPEDSFFNYYALEQIGNSEKAINHDKVVESYLADFEDDGFLVNGGHFMHAIVALRCLMPNTRLNYFFRFVENNLRENGVLILSHPLKFIDSYNQYMPLKDSEKLLVEFDKRLRNQLLCNTNMSIVYEENASLEYFYVVKVK